MTRFLVDVEHAVDAPDAESARLFLALFLQRATDEDPEMAPERWEIVKTIGPVRS